jgi:acyl-CoA reductase-like NAD-dependent aldehyde dehydrogenase
MTVILKSRGEAHSKWAELAARLKFDTECFIGGRLVSHEASGSTFRTINPATGHTLATFSVGSTNDVDRAVRAARESYRRTWRRESPRNRQRVLLNVAAAIESRAAEFALRDSLEMGKPITHALGDVSASVAFLRYYAEAADKVYGEVAPTDAARGLTLTIREPWGVVGAIVPWNFPLLTACMAVGPALATGNTVVLKPSEVSPSSALLLAAVAAEAGLPPGVLNVVIGLGETVGAALASHMDIDKLHFTGSTTTGRKLLEYAGRSNGKAVMLEVGGKSPQIVFADAIDIPGLAESVAGAAFFNSGQVCVSRSRLIVEAGVLGDLLRRLRLASQRFEAGNPLDERTMCGPLASIAQTRRVREYLLEAREAGILDGSDARGGEDTSLFVDPVILSGVRQTMRIAQEEIFGPVLMVCTFDSVEEAIEQANGTSFGLAATAWTTDLRRATHLARDIDAGRIEIRAAASPGAALELFAAEPFRGSGYGILGGMRGLDPYTRHKAIEIITH